MDAFLTILAIVAALFVLDIAAILVGSDTRDGFGEDGFRTSSL
jgi:hypothetical protein